MKKKENPDICRFTAMAARVRARVLRMIHETKSPHIGPSFSIADVLTALYGGILDVSPQMTSDPARDIFILSKGHACATLYAVLAETGFMTESDLCSFATNGGIIGHHPDRDTARGIELSTGSLGHGLSVGAGMAMAAKNDGTKRRVFVMMSDGELNEGSIWEAALFAPHHGLNNLAAIIDSNRMQALGDTADILDTEPLKAKWESFGWKTVEIDGHDFDGIFAALDFSPDTKDKRPLCVIARTLKGKGVSFMENKLLWHYRPPDAEEYERALKEIKK